MGFIQITNFLQFITNKWPEWKAISELIENDEKFYIQSDIQFRVL